MNFTSQTKLFDILYRSLEWPIIEAGIRSCVFDELLNSHSAKEIASKFKWKQKQTTLYLDALVSLGVVSKQQGVYELLPEYSELLVLNHRNSMIPMLLQLNVIKQTTAERILSTLDSKEIPDQAQRFDNAHFWKKSTENLRSFHRSVACNYYSTLLQSQPFWYKVNRILEIGAGSDELARTLTLSNPLIHYHIFDLPQVIEQLSIDSNVNQKIVLHSGDYNHTPIPQGYDLLFASMSLYYAKDLLQLMIQARQAINDGGCFVSVHEGLSERRTQPHQHVIGRFMPAMRGDDVSFNKGDIAQYMIKAGFKQVHSQSIHTPFGPMELDIAFK